MGFRWHTMKAASRLGVVGWVRNLPDGRVEVVGGGSRDALNELEATLRRGPSFSRVDQVDASDIEHDMTNVNSFEIR